ncbi:MAG: GGDEF domain-containing protein [Hoeflea sp.]|nr:GGDEF domain-containing protein [Hoeflea sp.]
MQQKGAASTFSKAMMHKMLTVTSVSVVLSLMITATFIYLADAMEIMALGLWIALTCAILVSPVVTYAFQLQTLELESAHGQLSELHSRLHEAYGEMEHRANHDGMTGLANRAAFVFHLSALLEQSAQAYLLVLDADRFKQINDVHGHDAGDRVLKTLAAAISHSIRKDDLGARIGGEEFAVVLRNATRQEAMLVAQRIRTSVARTPTLTAEGVEIHVTVSIGLTSLQAGWGADEAMRAADALLYKAKRSGRNRVCVDIRERRAA